MTHAPDDNAEFDRKIFIAGPAGTGKTTLATRYLLNLLAAGVSPDRVLILVPQVTLARPYQAALAESQFGGGAAAILTVAGLARQAVEFYWPQVAPAMGFARPDAEPTFLNIETAQYFMARFARPRIEQNQFFDDDISIPTPRIISQVLDNLNRAALMRFPLDEVAARLIAAWGTDRQSSRLTVYRHAAELAAEFRQHCLQNNLLDFSLTMEIFAGLLLPDPGFAALLSSRFDYLIADNLEEDNPAAHDFIAWLMPSLRGAVLIADSEAGYRTFLGASPEGAERLRDLCDEVLESTDADSHIMSEPLRALGSAFNRSIGPRFRPPSTNASPLPAFTYAIRRFYPQMVDWAAGEIVDLIRAGVPPREIVVLAPFLSDSLRFTLTTLLDQKAAAAGIGPIPTLSHRPSRALIDETATRVLLTLAVIAHPEWIDGKQVILPPAKDVADTYLYSIGDLDPVRARLLADVTYRKKTEDGREIPALSSFARIAPEMQARITYLAGQRYETLREWVESYRAQLENEGAIPLDHFLRRLFGEVLSQPGYGFHTNLDAGRVAAQLIASAAAFRKALYPGIDQDWVQAGREYIALVSQRLLPALYAQNWQEEDADAVFLAPASTFLLRNRFVRYQFWLDVGSKSWGERLDQPLTHPYVLHREWQAGTVWLEDNEEETSRAALYKIMVGLIRRCREKVYMGIADLGESGFEQRGPLLHILQTVLGANVAPESADSQDGSDRPPDFDANTD